MPFLRLSLVGCAVCSLVASAFIVPREPGPGIVLSIVAVSLVAVTFEIDDKAQSPLFGLLQHRQSATMIVAGLLLTFAFNGQFFLVALVAPEHFSASQSSVTLVYSVEAIGAIVGSVVAGLVMRGDSPGRACAGGYLTALAGSLTLIYSFAAVDFSALVAGASLMGFATDMAVAGLTASILTTTRQDSPGLAQSLFSASRQVGGALGVAVYGSVANATSALWVGVLCSVVCIGLLCGQAQRSRCR